MINYGKQQIDQDDIDAVIKVLKSDFLTQGPAVEEFEKTIADYTGAKYCVAVANGTAALHIAAATLDLPIDSEGITSPNTFTASANCMLYNKVKPVFADIDSETYNISLDSIGRKINDKTSLIIPVHFAGQPCDMKSIKEMADTHGLKIIEDAAHAIGSSYADGDRVGSCKYSDLTIMSFHPVKTITTGEGGAITTNDPVLYDRLLMLRSHGITKNPDILTTNPGPWYYEMHELGFNYRMTDLQAALGVSQFNKLDYFKKRRREIVKRYNSAFSKMEWITIPKENDGVDSCFHLYVSLLDFNKIGKSRKTVMSELRSKGVGTQVHYIPVHTQPYYINNCGTSVGDCPNAEAYYEQALSLPLYPAMTDDDIDIVINAISDLGK